MGVTKATIKGGIGSRPCTFDRLAGSPFFQKFSPVSSLSEATPVIPTSRGVISERLLYFGARRRSLLLSLALLRKIDVRCRDDAASVSL